MGDIMEKYKFKYEYELFKNYKNGFDYLIVKDMWTDYFDCFDYVFGDWSYGKVRLKGFYSVDSKKVKQFNNINNVDEYIKDHCSYDCAYFILKKM